MAYRDGVLAAIRDPKRRRAGVLRRNLVRGIPHAAVTNTPFSETAVGAATVADV